jgi:hypothetical protein
MLFLELTKLQAASNVNKWDSLRSWQKSHSAVGRKQGRMTLSCYSVHTTPISHWSRENVISWCKLRYGQHWAELSMDSPRSIHGCGWAALASSSVATSLSFLLNYCSVLVTRDLVGISGKRGSMEWEFAWQGYMTQRAVFVEKLLSLSLQWLWRLLVRPMYLGLVFTTEWMC